MSRSNRNYGKLTDGVIKYAPNAIVTDDEMTLNPTNEQYLAAGWKRVTDTPPETDNAHYAEPNGWEETDGELVRVYVVREIVQPVRKWTPLTIKRGAVARGWWDGFKAILQAADGYEDFIMCQYIAEDDPMFAPIYNALCSQYGAEAVDTYLAELPTED